MLEIKGKYSTAYVMIDNIESQAYEHILKMLNNPAFTNPIAIMPDCHEGKGSVIGFTMKMSDKLVPNVVGVDIGCGVLIYLLCDKFANNVLFSKEDLIKLDLDAKIRKIIPLGTNVNETTKLHFKNDFWWKEINEKAIKFVQKYEREFNKKIPLLEYNMEYFESLCKRIGVDLRYAISSIGTLGGGNHYISIEQDAEYKHSYLCIHSGSRNLGVKICEYWQKQARKNLINKRQVVYHEEFEKVKATTPKEYWGEELVKLKKRLGIDCEKDLEWLEGEDTIGYIWDMLFAQTYASINRYYIGKQIMFKDVLNCDCLEMFETVHNYIDFDDFIIRKGAISSYNDKKMIIPMNMKFGSLICSGNSNEQWNFSAPHGAGRLMSRSAAFSKNDNEVRQQRLENFKEEMKDVYTTSVSEKTLDEAPFAYKDPETIIKCINVETIGILERIKTIYNLKASQ